MSKIADINKNFPQWYQDVVSGAGLAEHSPVKGSMIINPYGYALWENMKDVLDGMIKQAGVQNMYFPLFIPKNFFTREEEHIEGFSPEVAWVTIGGGKELEEPLAVRPTSETIIGQYFSDHIQSYRDLPYKINQWANVVRWEMRPRLFLRTTEFLWQEGHTCHMSWEDAEQERQRALDMYKDFVSNYLAMYVIDGLKSESEKFAGADITSTIEGMMGDKKALQMGTSHNLGQNFAKVFDIQYLDEKGERKYVYQTSWGVSTRMIGGLIMAHGDDKGLALPPNIAPVQVVIVPVLVKDISRDELEKYVQDLEKVLAEKGIRFYTDWDERNTVGWKFNEWELKGVPVRIEVGLKEMENNKITLFRRDLREKETVNKEKIKDIDNILNSVQDNMLNRHKRFTESNIKEINEYNQFREILSEDNYFIRSGWCGSRECEDKVKQDTTATVRVLPYAYNDFTKDVPQKENKNCMVCGQNGKYIAIWAKAY